MPSKASQNPTVANATAGTDLVKVNVSTSLYLRDKPKKDANKIGSVYKDDIITRLEKATQKVDGTYWDYVMTANGTKGYVARETFDYETTYKLYLAPINSDEVEVKSNKVKLDKQGKSVTTIPEATVKDFSDLHGKEVVVKNANGELLGVNDKLGTGCIIDGTYAVVVLGDVNGDGEVLAADALQILKSSTNLSNLSGDYLKAADIDNDGNVLATDALQALKYSTKSAQIEIN